MSFDQMLTITVEQSHNMSRVDSIGLARYRGADAKGEL
jgi:hypothetical protein